MRNVKLIPVRFITANAPYMSGEIAGFPEAIAKRFVDRKRAVYYTPPEEELFDRDAEVEATVEAAVEEEVAPAAEIVPKKLSGPWYMVGDEKIKGKAKAFARAAELNEA